MDGAADPSTETDAERSFREISMGRYRLMTIGFVLVLIGIQLYCVRSYSLTPQAAGFVQQRIMEVDQATSTETARPFFNTSFANSFGGGSVAPSRDLTPPSWLKWAALFAGSVLILQGAALPK
jgi:hypothetical protein